MMNVMLGPPAAVAGGTGKGVAGGQSGSTGATDEFMALMAALLAGLAPNVATQAQTEIAPGPNDGKVLQESAADVVGLALPEGLTEQAALVAYSAVLQTPGLQGQALASQSPLSLAISAHQGDSGDGRSTATALDALTEAPRNGAPAAVVSFTISKTDDGLGQDAQVLGQDAQARGQDARVAQPGMTPVLATLPVTDDAPVPDAPEIDVPKPTSPGGAGSATPATTVARGADTSARSQDEALPRKTEDEVFAPAPATGGTQPTERAKDVAPLRQALPAHSPRLLAHELAGQLRVAIREEGKEIQIQLRPPELGNLTIRVVIHDGVLQAHIAADRPDAARLLEQSLGNLEDLLADQGYELGGLDVGANSAQERQDGAAAGGTHAQSGGGAGQDGRFSDDLGRSDGPVATLVHDGDVDLLA